MRRNVRRYGADNSSANGSEWRLHRLAATGSPDPGDEMSLELRGYCVANSVDTPQTVREDLVAGIRREALLGRIRDHLDEQAGRRDHRLKTRRACMEILGRRYPTTNRAKQQSSY